MLTSGDVVDLDLGIPEGHEAGFLHPAIVVTSQSSLDFGPPVIQIVPVTTILRRWDTEVPIAADIRNGLDQPSSAQCQHVRGVSTARIGSVRGNVGPVVLSQVRNVLSDLMDLVG